MSGVGVMGAGHVGLVTGTCLVGVDNHVVCLDLGRAKVDKLRRGTVPIWEPGLEEIVRRNAPAARLQFTVSFDEGLRVAELVFVRLRL